MKPSDWFGVAVRVLGLWLLVLALESAAMALSMQNGWYEWQGVEPAHFYSVALFYFLPGLALLIHARFFVNLGYGEPSVEDPDDRPPKSSDVDPG